jgi:hypothetical protein
MMQPVGGFQSMGRANGVVWQEDMHLRTQCLQQQRRWIETLVRTPVQAVQSQPCGLAEHAPDCRLPGAGRFAVQSTLGAFADGTPFLVPTEAKHPPPLDVPDSVRNTQMLLALPIRQPGAVELAGAATSRYVACAFAAHRKHSASPTSAEAQMAQRHDPWLPESDELTGPAMTLARVIELIADKRTALDERWVLPSLLCETAPLAGLIAELSCVLQRRHEALAAGTCDKRHDAKPRRDAQGSGRSHQGAGRGSRFVRPGSDQRLPVPYRLAERRPPRGLCPSVRREWRAGPDFQPPASALRGQVRRHIEGTSGGRRGAADLSQRARAIPLRCSDPRAVLLGWPAAGREVRFHPGDARCGSATRCAAVDWFHRELSARPATLDSGAMVWRRWQQQRAAGFRSATVRCHRGSARERTRSAVPPGRGPEAAIEMGDAVRCAASIGPSPDTVRWSLLHSGRGFRK